MIKNNDISKKNSIFAENFIQFEIKNISIGQKSIKIKIKTLNFITILFVWKKKSHF